MQWSKKEKFFKCEAGSSLIIVGLAIGMILIILAVVVDTGRMYAVQAKAQNAVDAALLGAVATRDSEDVSTETAKLFNANYPSSYLGSQTSAITVSPDNPNGGVYTADMTVTLPGQFSHIINDNPLSFHITSQVTVGLNDTQTKSLEIALVLDNTGSMGNALNGSGTTKIAALQQSATDLVTILFGDASTLNNLHVSVVPYNIVVQIGTGHDSWMQSYPSDTQYTLPSSGSETNNTNSLPKYQALANGTLTGGTGNKGFAGNRFTDFMCGPYQVVHNGNSCQGFVPQHIVNTCSGFVPQCNTVTCAGFVPQCTTNQSCDAETGKCSPPTKSCTTCTPGQNCTSCTPQDYWTSCTPSSSYTTQDNYTCVPNGLNDVDDTAPTQGDAYKFRLPFEGNISATGGNAENLNCCGGSVDDHTWPQTLAPLLFDSNVKSDIMNDINQMQAGGDTRINVGLMWGWFTLSPKWQGLWDSGKPGLPAAASSTLQKAVVLMTDGLNDLGTSDDTETLAICSAMKAQGITIYTVGLGAPGDLNETLLQQCATQSTYYFNAPTTDELQSVFHQIGDIVTSNLTERLSQ